jgi:Zn-dependent oligopeptidase
VLPAAPPLTEDLPPFVWPRATADIEAGIKAVQEAYTAHIESILSTPDAEVTFANCISPLMNSPHFKTNVLVQQCKHLQHCSTDPEIRAAAEAATGVFSKLKQEGKTHAGVYAKVKFFTTTPEYGALNAYDKHFADAIVASFEASGLGLTPEQQAELQSLRDADVAVCAAYKKTLGEDKTTLSFTREELKGCTEQFISDRLQPNGTVKIMLQYPDIIPIMDSCSVAETRKSLQRAREVTAYPGNLELVAQGIGIRKRIAEILGKKSWAELATESRMAGSPTIIKEFIEPLLVKCREGAEKDLEVLKELKIKENTSDADGGLPGAVVDGSADGVSIEAHDTAFYSNLRLKSHGVDTEAIRQYFPLSHVVGVTMDIYQELLGLIFTEIMEFDTWHPDVRLFKVQDAESGEKIGFFYIDLHPREGKYNHAAIFHLLKRWGNQVPVDCMLCNLPAPSADGTPSLLFHDDVVTFFHEFGHIMHGLCAEGDGNATTYAKCPRDFVEAPSQMLENWCWTKEALGRLSCHNVTKEPLPDELLQSLIAAKNVGAGLQMVRQIYLGSLDLAIHGENPPADAQGLQDLVDEMRPRICILKNPEGANMLRNFGHLMNQYSAAYYGYLWAEVLSADMWKGVFEASPFDKEAGMRYRKLILAKGGVGKISEHLGVFLGRPPKQDAFLESRGLMA